MSAEPPQDQESPELEASLSEISRALDSLRDRVQRLGGLQPESPQETEPRADTIDAVDPALLGSLQEALALPSSGYAPAEMFGIAMDRTARLLESDRSMLFLVDPERGTLEPAAARGFRRDDLGGVSIAPGEGLVGRCFIEGRALCYGRPSESPPSDPFVARFPVRDAVAVPVRADGEVRGVLYAGRRGRSVLFTAEDMQLLLVIADRVGTACAHQRLVDRAVDHVARLREIEAFSGRALVGQDRSETLARACETACRLLRVGTAALGVPDGQGGLRLEAASGLPAAAAEAWPVLPDEGLLRELFATTRPVVIRDLRQRTAAPEAFLQALHLRGCLLVPLRIHDRMVGALYLGDERARDFSADEVEAAQVLASLIALALENERLYGEVRSAFQALGSAQERMVQSEKVRALGEMAGGIAHEFNNILAIILGKVQLMLARGAEESFREGLGQVEEAAWRAADIVRRLQAFAATKLDDAAAATNLNTLVHDAVTLTRGLWKDEAETRGARIEVTTDLEETPPVAGSTAELREAVTNLVLNAIDAMPRGGQLLLSTRTREGGVELSVRDSGEGMSDEVRRRVFDPFFSTRSPLRTGLGLSVVHGIVSRHGGRIEVSSEQGQGTTVTLWLPAGQLPGAAPGAPAPAADPAERREPPGDQGARAASVLVLEDEVQIREMVVEALAQAGYRVDSAPDGLSGLARFQREPSDVVLTDLSLPERSGLEVARAVKRMSAETPVVLVTGWGHLLDPVRLRESGVDLTLVKPFRLERVLAVVAEALRLRRPA
ncbi:MAG: GAF domain-containing protein [Candidatus Rokubacteria bacterium]|nr:GAF domain-containing protein [Candidatus Rokubacteria bacterium]